VDFGQAWWISAKNMLGLPESYQSRPRRGFEGWPLEEKSGRPYSQLKYSHPKGPPGISWDIGMTSADVIEIHSTLANFGIHIWIDGGWGVDALLGGQTRLHKDLDIVIEDHNVVRFERFLASRRYRRSKREIERPFNFVLADDNRREIDVHVILLDEKGNGNYGPLEKGIMYPADSLTGSGTIEGHPVRCISPEWMVRFHSGYVLTEKDYKDVSALCEKFGIELPEEYCRFRSAKNPISLIDPV